MNEDTSHLSPQKKRKFVENSINTEDVEFVYSQDKSIPNDSNLDAESPVKNAVYYIPSDSSFENDSSPVKKAGYNYIPSDSSFGNESPVKKAVYYIPSDSSFGNESPIKKSFVSLPNISTDRSSLDKEKVGNPSNSSFGEFFPTTNTKSPGSSSEHSTNCLSPRKDQLENDSILMKDPIYCSTPIKRHSSGVGPNDDMSTLSTLGSGQDTEPQDMDAFDQSKDEDISKGTDQTCNSANGSPSTSSVIRNHSMSIHEVKFAFECCQDLCTKHTEYTDLLLARRRFEGLSKSGRYQWLLNYLLDHTKKNEGGEEVVYYIAGSIVCKPAWLASLGVNESMAKKAVEYFRSGTIVIETRRKRFSSRKRQIALAWMENYFKKVGDKVPDGIGINLPSYLTYKSLYNYMKKDLLEIQSEGEVISYTLFTYAMKEDFPDVRIPVVNRFTKCDICTVLKEEKGKTNDEKLRNYYEDLLTVHNNTQKNERSKYYKHRQKAKDVDKKEKYLCIIIDGMDQEKLLIPRLINIAKSYANAWKLRTHLTGVINHGREVLTYIDIFQWPHDSNYTMNVLLKAIGRLEKIPDVLYLQMDNCFRENKNQYVLNFLAILVKMGIFNKIKINFLMVGHTHEDVDQLFSKIGLKIRTHNIRTLDELMNGVKKSYTPEPVVEFLEDIYDIGTWISDVTVEVHNITKPHCFVIGKGDNGDVIMRYKNWSTDDKWIPSKKPDECLVLLKSDQEIPAGPPSLLEPSPDKIDLKRLKTDIGKFTRNSAVFEGHHGDWWDNFLSTRMETLFGPKEIPLSWIIEELKTKKDAQQPTEAPEPTASVDTNPNSLASVPMPSNVPERVSALVEKHSAPLPQAYTGRYQPPQALAGQVTEVDNHLNALKEGVFVAIAQANSKPPIIGKVIAVTDETFQMCYWKGSWRKPWEPWLSGTPPEPWTDELPKSCILLTDFTLNEKNKLQHGTAKYLKQEYQKLQG